MKACPLCGIHYKDIETECDCGYVFADDITSGSGDRSETGLKQDLEQVQELDIFGRPETQQPIESVFYNTAVSPGELIQLKAGRATLIFLGFIGNQFFGALVASLVIVIIAIINDPSAGNLNSYEKLMPTMLLPAVVTGFILGGITMLIMAYMLVPNQLKDTSITGAAWRVGTPAQCAMGLLAGLVVAIVFFIFIILLFAIMNTVFQLNTGTIFLKPVAMMQIMGTTKGSSLIILIIMIVILAPFFEELLFRGIMLGGFIRSFGIWWGSGIVTVLFTIIHVPQTLAFPPAILGVFTMSVVTLFLRLETKAVGPAMAAHFAYNLVLASVALWQILH